MPPPSSDREPSSGRLVIARPSSDADVPELCERLRTVIATSAARTMVCDVGDLPADAHAVDALARLQLTARRLHRRLRLQRASPQLEQLLDFAGLADVVAPRHPGQRGRQPEQREQPRRREERMDRRDRPG